MSESRLIHSRGDCNDGESEDYSGGTRSHEDYDSRDNSQEYSKDRRYSRDSRDSRDSRESRDNRDSRDGSQSDSRDHSHESSSRSRSTEGDDDDRDSDRESDEKRDDEEDGESSDDEASIILTRSKTLAFFHKYASGVPLTFASKTKTTTNRERRHRSGGGRRHRQRSSHRDSDESSHSSSDDESYSYDERGNAGNSTGIHNSRDRDRIRDGERERDKERERERERKRERDRDRDRDVQGSIESFGSDEEQHNASFSERQDFQGNYGELEKKSSFKIDGTENHSTIATSVSNAKNPPPSSSQPAVALPKLSKFFDDESDFMSSEVKGTTSSGDRNSIPSPSPPKAVNDRNASSADRYKDSDSGPPPDNANAGSTKATNAINATNTVPVRKSSFSKPGASRISQGSNISVRFDESSLAPSETTIDPHSKVKLNDNDNYNYNDNQNENDNHFNSFNGNLMNPGNSIDMNGDIDTYDDHGIGHSNNKHSQDAHTLDHHGSLDDNDSADSDDMNTSLEEDPDRLNVDNLQTHILDSLVTLLRIQSMQSEKVLAANALRHRLFCQVVMKLLNPLSQDPIKDFKIMDTNEEGETSDNNGSVTGLDNKGISDHRSVGSESDDMYKLTFRSSDDDGSVVGGAAPQPSRQPLSGKRNSGSKQMSPRFQSPRPASIPPSPTSSPLRSPSKSRRQPSKVTQNTSNDFTTQLKTNNELKAFPNMVMNMGGGPSDTTNQEGKADGLSGNMTHRRNDFGMGMLLRAFPDENKCRDGRSWLPLHWAVVLGSTAPNNVAFLTSRDMRDIVSHDPLAVMRGLDMRSNATPGHLAAAACDSSTGITTLKHLAEVMPRLAHCPNNDGDLPLHFCVLYSRNLEAVKLLVELYPESTKVQGLGDMTPLYCAVDCRDKAKFDIIKYLVECDPDSILIGDSNGNNPLHFLAHQSKTLDDITVLECLLRACPTAASQQNIHGFTPLHFLCKNSTLARNFPHELAVIVANLLIHSPESASMVTHRSKKLPHHIAAEMSTCEVMNLLLKTHPRGIFECGQECGMPMHCVASSDNLLMFHFLFRRYPQAIAMCDEGGFFPIHYAVLNGSFEMICALLEKGPEGAGRVTYDGKLPLHLIMEDVEADESDDCNGGTITEVDKIIYLLLKLYPQAVSMPDNDGLTPYILCPSTNYNMRRMLLRASPKVDPFLLKELNYRARRWGLLLGFSKHLIAKQDKDRYKGRLGSDVTVIERLRRLPIQHEYLSKRLLYLIVLFL